MQPTPPTLPTLPTLQTKRNEQTALARRRQALGLLLIAGVILLVALVRAPAHVLFPVGWWRF